jgi:hypothetical protein
MRWRKLGLLFTANGQHSWMRTHASNPTAEVLDDGHVRVYFSTRDEKNRSHIAAAVFSLGAQPQLLDLYGAPLLAPGAAGAFDDSGTSMGCLVQTPDGLWLYYLGWNLGVTVPWRNAIGLAVSRDGGRSFTRHSPAPVMDRHAVDPFSLSYPWILRDGPRWRMWYGSNLRWGGTERDMDHVLKCAESTDGLNWQRGGRPIMPLSGSDEYAQARPCVLRDRDAFRAWFACRGERYRLGYAESDDGVAWRRDDPAGTLGAGSPGEWDGEMVTYPCVFDAAGRRYLLYNGNGYGRTGFGLAVLD